MLKVVPKKNPTKPDIVNYFKPCCSFSHWGIVTKQHNQPSNWRTSTYWLPTIAYETYWSYTLHSLPFTAWKHQTDEGLTFPEQSVTVDSQW